MFNMEQCYAIVNNSAPVKKYFGNNLLENEKIIEKKNGNITFKNERVKEFYLKYESELNSFKREKLHKIYNDLKLRVELTINTLDNTHKVVITSTKLEYIDYQNKENNCCIESSENLFRDYTLNMADISFVFYASILEKDEIGIFINNESKKYIYFFGNKKDLSTFLVG